MLKTRRKSNANKFPLSPHRVVPVNTEAWPAAGIPSIPLPLRKQQRQPLAEFDKPAEKHEKQRFARLPFYSPHFNLGTALEDDQISRATYCVVVATPFIDLSEPIKRIVQYEGNRE